ncbi:nucleotide-binding protein [Acinetobacter baumannii]|uniref:TIR domain-containing protein n=1 Tax=Acinetobacter baumannii TaxID=470 RepID=UPI00148EB8E3|nr:TIR domain-containing protein [Acinetobacter baumannii]MCY2773857.1 nucleotide-binding protein [Acinetobacter baumannii]MCY2776098.1 nucleotide-binding protein [Acinetobacter baumannii]MCY2799576.1 nucleotide-binding protein [Acinetobacter baumannii]MCY2807466.1 nucleotide-binding protein [Acinetobacter baumannii]MCY2887516.1 nucleotide-binding protein [Acinetobacter baumannii]
MSKPKLFIASSAESLHIVEAINIKLSTTCEVSQWDNAFDPSSFTFPTLVKKAEDVEFAVFVFHPDDEIIIRNNSYSIVRDNVLFELGLFVGKLGIEKCFIICPDNLDLKSLRIPSDLSGITFCTYDAKRITSESLDAVSTACGRMRMVINGYIQEQQQSTNTTNTISTTQEHIRGLESQVWRLGMELKSEQEQKNKLESLVISHFNSVARPATEREIKAWVSGAKDNYDNPEILQHKIFYTDKDIIMPTLYGANSIGLIVEKGARVLGIDNIGHSTIFFMEGFRKTD